MELLNTLYITTPYVYVHLDNATICVESQRELLKRVPMHHIKDVVCFGSVTLSPALMHTLAEQGIGMALLDERGRFKARLQSEQSGNIYLRQAQFDNSHCQDFVLALAQAIVAGKIKNSRQLLQKGLRDQKSDNPYCDSMQQCVSHLGRILKELRNTLSLEDLRGYEGYTAQSYFPQLNGLMKASQQTTFQITNRNRRPPRDPFNALISFLYTLLMNDCRSALETVGLDPQLGYLHSVKAGRPALALDLMEEFRALLSDRVALTLVNRGQLQAKHFDWYQGGSVYLNDEGRQQVLQAYEKRKRVAVKHPLVKSQMPMGLIPMLQARLLARVIRGDMSYYVPFWQK